MTTSYETYAYSGIQQEVRSSLREIDSLDKSLARLGAKRVMLLCGKNVLSKSNVVTRVREAIGPLCVGQFEGVEPHSPIEAVELAGEMARDLQPDTLISVGGGSAIVMAKGLALTMSSKNGLVDFRLRFELPDKLILPEIPLPEVSVRTVAVSTTMGCAEIGPGGGAFASHSRSEKISILGDGRTSPKLIVVDGDALATTPTLIQKSTAIGQLRVAIESLTSKKHNHVCEALGLCSVKMLYRELVGGWQNDPAFLLRVKAGCCLATHAQNAIGSMGVNSAIAHQMGAICDVPHGQANAIVLPHTIRFNAIEGERQIRLIADSLDIREADLTPTQVAEEVAARIESLCASLDLPLRLRDVGVTADSLELIASAAAGDRATMNNARTVRGKEDIVGILERAW